MTTARLRVQGQWTVEDLDSLPADLKRYERRDIIHAQRIYGAPDLVVEVLSPRTTETDRTSKREAYAQANVLEYWLLDGDAEVVTVLVLQDGEYVEQGVYHVGDIATSTVLEGFAVDVGVLFRDLPRE